MATYKESKQIHDKNGSSDVIHKEEDGKEDKMGDALAFKTPGKLDAGVNETPVPNSVVATTDETNAYSPLTNSGDSPNKQSVKSIIDLVDDEDATGASSGNSYVDIYHKHYEEMAPKLEANAKKHKEREAKLLGQLEAVTAERVKLQSKLEQETEKLQQETAAKVKLEESLVATQQELQEEKEANGKLQESLSSTQYQLEDLRQTLIHGNRCNEQAVQKLKKKLISREEELKRESAAAVARFKEEKQELVTSMMDFVQQQQAKLDGHDDN
jgi:hypothetical protein